MWLAGWRVFSLLPSKELTMGDDPGDSKRHEEPWVVPDGWPDVPRYIVFFLTAPVPLGLPDQWKGSLTFDEERVEWLAQSTPGASSIRERYAIPDNPEGKPFVSLLVDRFEFPFGSDSGQFLLARAAYEKMKGVEEFEFDAHFYSQAVAGALEVGASTFVTVFEVVTPLDVVQGASAQPDLEASVWRAFRRALDTLELIYRAYVTTVDDWAVRPLSRQQLNPLVPWTTLAATTGEVESVRLFQVNDAEHWPQGAKETLSDQTLQYLQAHMQVVLSSGDDDNPHLNFVEHSKRAQHAYYAQGDYEAAIVWSQISSECLLTGALLMTAWEAGADSNEVIKWIKTPLRKRVRAYFGKQLGGTWDTRDTATIVGRWSLNVVQLRNSIVHASMRVTEEDAIKAHNACVDLEWYVKRRLFESRKQYPRTALVFIGIAGMQDRGASNAWLDTVTAKMEKEPDLMDAYGQWAQSIYARFEE